MPNPLLIPVWRWLRTRRFPTLLKITAAVFVVNVFVPDPIPFIDELLLGLATLTLAAIRRPRDEVEPLEPDTRADTRTNTRAD